MRIEKQALLGASTERAWALLLDPVVMAACVPGMASIEVISDTEYLATIKVRISFVSASFRIRTTIVDQRPSVWLRSVGTGEDSALASTLRHDTQIALEPAPEGQTLFRVESDVEVLGRVGAFGLSAMKTKADRLWDAFVEALQSRLAAEAG